MSASRKSQPIVPALLLSCLVALFRAGAAENTSTTPLAGTDFRYAPPWWQTAICLPDDPDKALVGKEGQLLFDFGRGGVRNFGICLQPEVSGESRWLRQETFSGRVPVVRTWKGADGVEVLEEAFIVTPKPGETDVSPQLARTDGPPIPPPRRALLLMTLKNSTSSTLTRQPALRINTAPTVICKLGEHCVFIGDGTRLMASEEITSCFANASNNCLLQLPPIVLKPGASHQVAFTVERHHPHATAAVSAAQARHLLNVAQRWWEKGSLPFDTLQMPDAGIQAMVESCVRNIWQAREIKNGQPAFHVGPTVYRGLWVVDGSFLLETAALLGRGKEARAGVEYLLSHQNPDGSFDLLGHYWKENGIVLWAATRHAMLTQDKPWLRTHWSNLQRVVKAIENLRALASKDPAVVYYRLLPPGTIDGGIGGNDKPEYSNIYWTLAGLRAAISAAQWLGDEQSAAAWQREYDDFYAVWRRAAERDTLQDSFGNAYVPTLMGNLNGHVPARGQWAFCHAVYPGQIFSQADPLVESQLAMLRATKVEGMVFDTGWMRQGIWTYFASFYGHALLWQGHAREAAEVLYSFAQHAAPTRVWREEQKPRGKGSQEVGDMPHNWASAEFIRLTTHLIELDRGEDLHLLEGFPHEWAAPGMVTRLNGVLTPFGPLHLEVRVSPDGRIARVKMAALTGRKPAHIILHLSGLKERPESVVLPADGNVDRSF